MPTPMTTGDLRTLLAEMPDDTALYDDMTGRPILDIHVGVDGALVLELDGPAPGPVVNSFVGSGEFSGVLIQTGGDSRSTIRF
ncbi:hypothetical protein [Nocardiopsis sp. NPDC055824]